jgi:hypothetical protein
VLGAKKCTPTPFLFVVFILGLVIESIKEFGGASLLVAIDGYSIGGY